MADFNKALDLSPKYALAYVNRGDVYYYYRKDTLSAFNDTVSHRI